MLKSWPLLLLLMMQGCAPTGDADSQAEDQDNSPNNLQLSRLLESLSSGLSDYEDEEFSDSPYSNLDAPAEQWEILYVQQNDVGDVFAIQQSFARISFPQNAASVSEWSYDQVMFAQQSVTRSGSVSSEPSFQTQQSLQRVANDLAGVNLDGAIWVNDQRLKISNAHRCEHEFVLQGGLLDEFHFASPRCGKKTSIAGLNINSLKLTSDTRAPISAGWLEHSWGKIPPSSGMVVFDRFWLQIDDSTSITLLRRKRRNQDGPVRIAGEFFESSSGSASAFASDVAIDDMGEHLSNTSNLNYPTSWKVQVPEINLDVLLTPVSVMQEHSKTGDPVWQGAVRIDGSHTGLGFVLHHAKPTQ